MVKLKLHTQSELNILATYIKLINRNMLETLQSMESTTGIDALFLNGKIEIMQQLLRTVKIKQIDHKPKNTISLLDLQAAILIKNNHGLSVDKYSLNMILNYTYELHKQLINH